MALFRKSTEVDNRRPRKSLHSEIMPHSGVSNLSAGRIALGYAVIAILWIAFSDAAVTHFKLHPAVMTIKGTVFVFVTASLLYFAIRRLVRAVQLTTQERDETAKLYRTVVEASNEGICLLDESERISFLNGRLAAMLGRPAEELHGSRLQDFIEEPHVLAQRGAQKSETYECRLRKDSDRKPWVLISRHPVLNDAGEVAQLVCTVIDITERRRAEEALALHSFALNNAHEAVCFTDEQARFLYVNEECCRSLGYANQELLSMSVPDVDPDFPKERWPDHWHTLRAQRSLNFESHHRTKDGRFFPVEISAKYLEYGGRAFNLAVIRDITERKRTEEALRENETRFRTFVDHAMDAFFLIGDEGKILDVNRQACESLGYTHEELITMATHDIDPNADAIRLQLIHEQLETGAVSTFETLHRRKDGTLFPVEVRIRALWQGGCRLNVALARDITERKRAEEALRESETRFRTFVDHAGDALFVQDLEQGTIVDVNRTACESLGYTRQELVGKTPLAFHLDSDRAAMESAAERAATGETAFDRHSHRRKDGSIFPVEVHTSLLSYGGRRFLLKVARDISDRLRAENAIRESEKQLRDVIDTIPAIVWSTLPDGSVDFINRRTVEFTGLSFEQASGGGWQSVIHPEDRDDYLAVRRAAMASGQAFEFEARVRRADGEYRWMLFRSVSLRDETGTVVKQYGVCTDIDDRNRAQQALKRSEGYLAETQRLTHTGTWATDAEPKPLYWSEELFRLYGLDPQQGSPTHDEAVQRVYPEDRERYVQAFHRVIHQKVDSDVEFRTVLPDGTIRHLYGLGHPILNTHGDVVEVVGTTVDITERKRAEEERATLRQLEADLAHINRVSMMGELTASIAHEVNQPLSGIVSNASACLRWLAGDAPDVEEVREAVRDIVRDGKRAGEVVARIRALTKRAAGPRERLDLNETIREVLALVGDQARRSSVIVRTQFADDLSPVAGDRVQLQQVVLNLVMNAIEAMSSVVERARELVIATRNVDPDQVQVTVEDSGIGFDPNTINKIFDSFYTTKPAGMGMGLSISRSILQAHGGRLWVTPKTGPGTVFHFIVPKYHEEEANAGVTGV